MVPGVSQYGKKLVWVALGIDATSAHENIYHTERVKTGTRSKPFRQLSNSLLTICSALTPDPRAKHEYLCQQPPPRSHQGLFTGTEEQEEEDNGSSGGGTKPRITCTDRSANGLVVAAGDGHSRIRLYRHPCPGDRPPPALFHELKGHGAGGVSRARFLRGGGFLVTTGESDRQENGGAVGGVFVPPRVLSLFNVSPTISSIFYFLFK